MRIELITDIHEFAALKDEWDELFEKNPDNSIFLSHDWLYSWWETYGAGHSLYILVCRDVADNRVAGLFPAYQKNTWKLFRSLKFLGSEYVASDSLDIMTLPHVMPAVYEVIFRYISDNATAWDIVEFTGLVEDSPLLHFLCTNAPINLDLYQPDTDKACPCLELTSGWDQFLQTKSSNSKSKILYRRKSLEKRFHVQLTEVLTESQLEVAFKDIVRLQQGRGTFQNITSMFSSREFRHFIMVACKRMFHKERLQLVFLELNGRKVAYCLNLKQSNRVFCYQIGSDKVWDNFRIKYVLLSHVIEKAIGDHYKTYEFSRGDEKYKSEWAKSSRRLSEVIIFNNDSWGLILKYVKLTCYVTEKIVASIVRIMLMPVRFSTLTSLLPPEDDIVIAPHNVNRNGYLRNRMLVKFGGFLALVVAAIWIAYAACVSPIVSPPLRKADVIVLLSGSREERTPAAAYLYRNGYADRVLLTNDGVFSSWSQVYNRNLYQIEWAEEELVRLGVPREKIVKLEFYKSGTIYDARAFRNYVNTTNNITSALLVTSNYHINRALWSFRNVCDNRSVIFMGYPATSGRPGSVNIIKENCKLLWYRLNYGLLGRTP